MEVSSASPLLTDSEEFSESGVDGKTPSAVKHRLSAHPTVHIPSSEGLPPSARRLPSAARRKSSSEESDDDELDDSISGPVAPEILLKRSRKQARLLAKEKDERAVYERIRCLALTRIVYGDNHWQLAKSYAKLAQAYLEVRALPKQALKHAENARDVLVAADAAKKQYRQQYEGSDVLPVMELTYLIMGQSQGLLKRYNKAEQTLKKAELVSRERNELGAQYRNYERRLKIFTTLGKICLKQRKFGSALEWFEKAQELALEEYGEGSEEMIPIYQNLGRAEQSQGDAASHERALKMYLRAHKIAKVRYPEGSTAVADSSFTVAVAYMSSDSEENQEKGRDFLDAAIATYSEQLGPYEQKTIKAQDELCRFLIRNGNPEGAASLLKSLVDAKRVTFGDPSEEAATSCQLLGSIRLKQGRTEQALRWLSKCHGMLHLVLGPSHKKTKTVAETIQLVKRSPAARGFQTSGDKLKERPRFAEVVGRSKPLGVNSNADG